MHVQNNTCPCCNHALLRHIRQGGIYWFCTSCWQEVPIIAVSRLPVKGEKVKVEPALSMQLKVNS